MKPKKAVQVVDILQYKGLIVSRAAIFFRMLPLHWRDRTDFLDFVSDGVWFVLSRLPKWNAKKGKVTTFIVFSLDNYYRGYLTALISKKRGDKKGVEHVCFDEILGGVKDIRQDLVRQIAHASVSVERVHKDASHDLLCLLDNAFFNPHQNFRIHPRSPNFQPLRREFQTLVRRHDVSIDDYRAVINLHHTKLKELDDIRNLPNLLR